MFINDEKAHKIFNELCKINNTDCPTFAHYVKYDLSRTWPGLVRDYKQGRSDLRKGIKSPAVDFMQKMKAEQKKEWDKIKFVIYEK